MSAVSFNSQARRETYFSSPTTSTTATIYTAPSNIKAVTLDELNIASGASGASASVWLNDGSTDRPLLLAKAIAANTTETYSFGRPVMRAGNAIKVRDGTGNILHFTLTVAIEGGQ